MRSSAASYINLFDFFVARSIIVCTMQARTGIHSQTLATSETAGPGTAQLPRFPIAYTAFRCLMLTNGFMLYPAVQEKYDPILIETSLFQGYTHASAHESGPETMLKCFHYRRNDTEEKFHLLIEL